jgi:hypothetical protein
MWSILTVRYIRKVRLHKAKIARAIYRYFVAFGVNAMVFISIIVFLTISLGTSAAETQDYLYFIELIAGIAWLAILFSIVPKGRFLSTDPQPMTPPSLQQPATDDHDPKLTDGERHD